KMSSASSSSASATVVTTTEFDRLRSTVLASGARGAEVKVLQRALGGIAVDGAYGSATVKAVRAFQKSEGLSVTGIVDEKTWINLERQEHPFLRYRTTVLKPGSTGRAVRVLQEALGLEVDGIFGSATREAVRALQARAHLTRTGYVGGVTWQALEREARSPQR
ncbi:peptidoglycan-binding domain-containing protein, partial [Janibacter limosus]|uniref:peptidoglycan-binding domain-containing protein n=1 Tax=Janibacter limosus TaxID=53458 RepID=UPI000B0C84B1